MKLYRPTCAAINSLAATFQSQPCVRITLRSRGGPGDILALIGINWRSRISNDRNVYMYVIVDSATEWCELVGVRCIKWKHDQSSAHVVTFNWNRRRPLRWPMTAACNNCVRPSSADPVSVKRRVKNLATIIASSHYEIRLSSHHHHRKKSPHRYRTWPLHKIRI